MARKAKVKAKDSSDAAKAPSYRVAKIVLTVLVLGDLALGGLWLYLEFKQLKDVERALTRNERGLIQARQQIQDLKAVVTTIKTNKIEGISDPGGLILKIAESFKINDKIRVERPREKRWGTSNYVEVTVPVNFKMKEGYGFGGIIKFLEKIEQKNPKLLIKDMNFGSRVEDEETDTWRPTGTALAVRTFKLKT